MPTLRTRDFLDRLAWLKRHTKVRSTRIRTATVSTSNGALRLESGPLDVTMTCDGNLPLVVTFDAQALRSLLKVPPTEREIEVVLDGDHLRIGSMSVPVIDAARMVEVPAPPQLALDL